ncbi:MAG: hypothetical protein Q8L88_03300 [Bacteroidota bacterium]|nr:hypothetical protein [Bacteroidota bacterium]
MKKYSVIFIILAFVFTSCKEQLVTTPIQQLASQNGNVSLAFEKSQIPETVKIIRAVLKRNSDSLINTLNAADSGSAEIVFSKVPVGIWKLKIDAMNADNIILYTGSVDVTVLENMVTNVNLVLQQISTGVGSVKITVTWAQNSSWFDFSSIPILYPQGTQYDGRGIGYPFVTYDDSLYKMWYLNIQSAVNSKGAISSVGYATSKDGLTWKHYSQEPVLTPTQGTWDAFIIGHGTILRDETGYKLYYCGYNDNNNIRYSIGLATSSDGIQWEKKTDPVFKGTNSWDYSIGVKGVLKVNNKYFMYYGSSPASGIGLATSADGITWTRYPSNPIINPTESWEGGGIGYASVIYDEGKFKMVYVNNGYSSGFGYATSEDGIHWIKDASNPIFTKEKTKNLWAGNVGYPSLTKVGNKLMIYYTGMNSNGLEMRIGVAIKN